MLALDGVGFGKEGESVVYPSVLGGLAYLPLVVLIRSLENGLPDILHEGLVGVVFVCQYAAYPCFCDFFVSVYSVIYVPGALHQCPISFLDSLHSLIGSIYGAAA